MQPFVAVLLLAALSPPPTDPLLAGIEQRLTSVALPRYVEYTVTLSDVIGGGIPEIYRVRMRTSDHASLVTEEDGHHAGTGLHFERPMFYEIGAPSPFAIDAFRLAPDLVTAPNFAPKHLQPVATFAQAYHTISQTKDERGNLHAVVSPCDGNTDRYRVREIVTDPSTGDIKRIISTDYAVEFRGLAVFRTGYIALDIVTQNVRGIQLITAVEEIDVDKYGKRTGVSDNLERYGEFSFPAALPDWYFNEREYRAHASDPLP